MRIFNRIKRKWYDFICWLGFHDTTKYYCWRCGHVHDWEEYHRRLKEAIRLNKEYGKKIYEWLCAPTKYVGLPEYKWKPGDWRKITEE